MNKTSGYYTAFPFSWGYSISSGLSRLSCLLALAVTFFFLGSRLFAQEILTGIQVNQAVRDHHREAPKLKSLPGTMLELPFFDDFSKSRIYPDNEKWADNHVFINYDYPVNPVSAGVATFDALDHTGAIYPRASIFPFLADQLTSRPVNLHYSPQDSIYLSFYYQPQGRGDIPQKGDSLRLEFYSPETDGWSLVWSVPGEAIHDFRLVMIPVTSPLWLQEGFRFRFSNKASISDMPSSPGAMGNGDHWHVDYIYLNSGRNFADTIFRDVALIEPPGSLLINYESMPWAHFVQGRVAEMASVITLTCRNNDNVTRNIGRRFSIYNVHENKTVYSYNAGAANIGPSEIVEFSSDLAYSFDAAGSDQALFRIKTWIETAGFDFKGNDTVTYLQKFGDYFAFDDGTAEKGYGLFGGGTENARLAVRFNTYRTDSLKAIDIFFNQSLNNVSQKFFHLAIWDDNNGRPGNIIYASEGLLPVYEENLNRFHRYHLDRYVTVPRVFYAGIIQTSNEFINLGWDINRDNSHRIFYNIHGDWRNTAYNGSLMIRPVTAGVPVSAALPPPYAGEIRVYPNPATRYIHIGLSPDTDRNSVVYKLYNTSGQMVYRGTGQEETIEVSGFPPGIYFLNIEDGTMIRETRRIVITR
jgi:hypothetical protein